MPYISRDANGNITGSYRWAQVDAAEFLDETDPAYVKWLLLPYANDKHAAVINGGITVNVGTQAAPVNVRAGTDAGALVLLQGALMMANANATSFNWVQTDGVAVTLTSAQIVTLFTAVTAFLQATFDTLAGVLAAIAAGTVTTQEQIDSFASPAWPSNA